MMTHVPFRIPLVQNDGFEGGKHTQVVGAHLQRLVTTHDQTDLGRLLVLQQTDVTGSAFLPFQFVLGEAEQLGAPIESASVGWQMEKTRLG